jgi:hypothetical protein
MNIIDLVYDLIDTLTSGADYIVDYDVEIISETPTTVTANWTAIVIMRVDEETPITDLLPALPIPSNPTKETRQLFVKWDNEDSKTKLNSKYHYEWDEGKTIMEGISWDDKSISDADLEEYLSEGIEKNRFMVDDCELGDALFEWGDGFDAIDMSNYPKRFHPYISKWIDASDYKE